MTKKKVTLMLNQMISSFFFKKEKKRKKKLRKKDFFFFEKKIRKNWFQVINILDLQNNNNNNNNGYQHLLEVECETEHIDGQFCCTVQCKIKREYRIYLLDCKAKISK